jgi:hypothetical protein
MSELAHPSGYEKHDLPIGKIALYALAGIIFLTVVAILGRSLFILAKERTYERQVMQAPAPYLEEVQADATRKISSYGVVDEENGVYHIPIDVAKQKFLDSQP